MENFKKKLKKRILWSPFLFVIVVLISVFGIIFKARGSNEDIYDFITGFHFGFTIGILSVAVFYTIKYSIALRNEEKLRQLYIEEHDERTQYINSQIGGVGMAIIIVGLGIGTVIAGYVNEVMFFTFLGSLFFTLIVKVGLKLYYNNKY